MKVVTEVETGKMKRRHFEVVMVRETLAQVHSG